MTSSTSSSGVTSSGTLAVSLAFGQRSPATGTSHKRGSVTVGLPLTASTLEIRLLDPNTGADLVSPQMVTHTPGATNQTVTVNGVRAGNVRVLVTAFDGGSSVIGYGIQAAQVDATSTSTVQVANTVTLSAFAITPSEATAMQGTTQQFTATATFSDNSQACLNCPVTWTSSTPAVASVSTYGVAAGVTPGTTIITGSFHGSQATATFHVQTTASLTSVGLTPLTPTVTVNTANQLTATATFADGTTQDVSALATWNSGTPTVATVVAGLVSGLTPGTSNVSASFRGKTGSTLVTVQAAQVVRKKWNFLVYLDADNNLESDGIMNFNQMENVGSNDDVNVLVLFDRGGQDSSNGAWKGTRLYKVTRDADTSVIHSEIQTASPWGKSDDSVEADMANPQTLTNFIVYCQQNYPADHTVLTVWNHGGGVYPRSLSGAHHRGRAMTGRGICWDDTSASGYASGWNCITTDELQSALASARTTTGQKIDILNFDACLMQLFELAYQLRNEVDFMVGSEETVPGAGNNYQYLLARLEASPTMTARTYAIGMVQDYYTQYQGSGASTTYSALDLSYMPTFTTAFKQFATELNTVATNSGSNPTAMAAVYTASWDADYYDYNELIDLYGFASNLGTTVPSAPGMKTAISTLVISHVETGSHVNLSHGLGILAPWNTSAWQAYSGANQYALLGVAQDTNWKNFIVQLAAWGTAHGH